MVSWVAPIFHPECQFCFCAFWGGLPSELVSLSPWRGAYTYPADASACVPRSDSGEACSVLFSVRGPRLSDASHFHFPSRHRKRARVGNDFFNICVVALFWYRFSFQFWKGVHRNKSSPDFIISTAVVSRSGEFSTGVLRFTRWWDDTHERPLPPREDT